MTRESDKHSDQVKQGDKRSKGGYPDSSEPSGHGAQTPPVRTQPPAFVAITEEQHHAALRALIDLLVDDRQRHGDD